MSWWSRRKLRSDDVRSRRRAASELATDSAALPLLVQAALRDLDDEVRAAAARSLALGPSPPIDALRVGLSDPDEVVRAHAVQALGLIGTPAAFDVVRQHRDQSEYVRIHTGRTLAMSGDQKGIDRLVAHLDSFQFGSFVRRILVEIGDAAVPALGDAVVGPHIGRQQAAAKALEAIGTAKAKAALAKLPAPPKVYKTEPAVYACPHCGGHRFEIVAREEDFRDWNPKAKSVSRCKECGREWEW